MRAFAFCRAASRRAPQVAESRGRFASRHSATLRLPGFTSEQNCLTSSAHGSSGRPTSSAPRPAPGTARNSRNTRFHLARITSSLPTYLRYDHPMVTDMLKSLFTPPSGGRLS